MVLRFARFPAAGNADIARQAVDLLDVQDRVDADRRYGRYLGHREATHDPGKLGIDLSDVGAGSAEARRQGCALGGRAVGELGIEVGGQLAVLDGDLPIELRIADGAGFQLTGQRRHLVVQALLVGLYSVKVALLLLVVVGLRRAALLFVLALRCRALAGEGF